VEVPVVKFAMLLIAKSEPGVVVPTPTLPLPRMVKSVAFVSEATVKRRVDALPAVDEETASCENGEVVPMPIAEVVADWPESAWVHASYDVNAELVIVTGEEPMTVKPVQEVEPVLDLVLVVEQLLDMLTAPAMDTVLV